MQATLVNPWSWQEALGFVQARAVDGVGRIVWCAGQTSVDADGRPLHAGDEIEATATV